MASDSAPPRPAPSDAWLLARYKRERDVAAREELVRRLLPVARRVASSYPAHGHADDLLQAACLGLTKAIDRFDPAHGVSLRTYAVPTMLGEVRRYLRDHSWSVRVPRPLQERVLAVTKSRQRLTTSEGRAPTPQAIAEDLDLALEEVLEALQAGSAYSAESFDAPVAHDDADPRSLGDVIGSEDPGLSRAEDMAALGALGIVLDDRERRVLYLRVVRDMTQTEIAAQVGVSQMQVSRIIRRSITKLSTRARQAA